MFLDMLTADAASKHGHEFSEPQPAHRWLAAGRSPLRVLPYAGRPRVPARSRSVRGVVGELSQVPEEADSTTVSRYYDMSVDDLHIPGSYRHDSPPVSPPRARSVQLHTSALQQTQFAPPTDSRALSAASATSDRKSRRPKTQFSVAVPPPSALPLRKQGIARPRALFQLQTRADSRFHRPIYELVPLSRIDGTRKVGQLIRRLGKAKDNITNDDLAVVKVESYSTATVRRESMELPETRDILGIISPTPTKPASHDRQAQIFLDGAVWDAASANSGKYNLQCRGTDKHLARWYVPKTQKRRPQSPNRLDKVDRKLYFAAILPHTTKHPTLASLNKTNLDIYDWYTLNTESDVTTSASPMEATQEIDLSDALASPVQHTQTSSTAMFNVPIDELHRRLIVVSSFWVMLCEGWSSQYSFPVVGTCNQSTIPSIDRSMSLPITRDDRWSLASTTQPSTSLSTRHTTPERSSLSAISPAPSINTETSNPKSKRMSFSSFHFGRAHSSAIVSRGSERSSVSYDTQQSTQHSPQTQASSEIDQIGPLDADERRASIATPRRQSISIWPPSSAPVRQSSFGLGTIVRRVSNSVALKEEKHRRSRSISWRWPYVAREDSHDPEQKGAVSDNTLQTEVDADTVINVAPGTPAGPAPDKEESMDVTTDHAALSEGLDRPTDDLFHDCDDSARLQPSQLPVEPEQVEEMAKTSVVGPPVNDTLTQSEPPSATEAQMRGSSRWSLSSSDSQQFDGATPYWKEFDRLQMDTFWGRASSMSPSATMATQFPASRASPPAEPHWQEPVPTFRPAESHYFPAEETVLPSIERLEDQYVPPRPTSMMDNLRQSFRRRKRLSLSGRLMSHELT